MTRNIEGITATVQQSSQFIPNMVQEMERILVGQRYLIDRLILGLLTGEHILVEGVPGLAKTTAVKTLAQTVKANFKRIQFTPDLLPADLIGTQVYQPKTEEFVVKKGPSSPTSFWRMKSTAPLPKYRARFWKPWKSDRLPSAGKLSPARPLHGDGHAEPHRTGRHLSSAGSAGGSFRLQTENRLPF